MDFWEPFVVDSINKAAHALNAWEPGREEEYRRYVVDNYSPAVLVPKFMAKIESVCV
jgi:hypothetical protein